MQRGVQLGGGPSTKGCAKEERGGIEVHDYVVLIFGFSFAHAGAARKRVSSSSLQLAVHLRVVFKKQPMDFRKAPLVGFGFKQVLFRSSLPSPRAAEARHSLAVLCGETWHPSSREAP